MSIINVYDYDTSVPQQDLKFLLLPQLSSQSSAQFSVANVGFDNETISFLGNFTLSSGNVSGGTISGVNFYNSFGTLNVAVTGLSIPVTSNGYSISFSLGTVFAPGSTYVAKSYGAYMEGVGNDTYICSSGSSVQPGLGVNSIQASGSDIKINFISKFSADTLSIASDGSLVVIDNSSSGTAYDDIVGSATLSFVVDNTTIQDNQGHLSGTTLAGTAANFAGSPLPITLTVSDSAANVQSSLDTLQSLVASGHLSAISFTDATTPTLKLSSTQLAADAAALADISSPYSLEVTGVTVAFALNPPAAATKFDITDTSAHVLASLDTLSALISSHQLVSIALIDAGIPTLSVTAAQLTKDSAALADITSSYVLTIAAGTASQTIDGGSSHGNLVQFSGTASQYGTTADGLGGVLVTTSGATDHVDHVTALQFSDFTDFVASETPATSNGVSSFQVATLYAAVLARTPDVAGLAYYENMAATNPKIPITTYAQYFLQSPEYTTNPARNYAQSSSGDAQFIADTYSNLLHRAPAAGDVAWYQANVIAPGLASATPGTRAYATAELMAHAAVLADFSQSAEFKGDVQVTAQAPSSTQHWLILI